MRLARYLAHCGVASRRAAEKLIAAGRVTVGGEVVTDPARVTFRTAAVLDNPELGIRHDRAYWVSGIRGRKDGFIDTDLTSLGCGGREPNLIGGAGAGADPVPWTSLSQNQVSAFQLPVRQSLQGELRNVASATIEAVKAAPATCCGPSCCEPSP